MDKDQCGCGGQQGGQCPSRQMDAIFSYWCESCRRSVPEKRCPYCGLKAQKKREK